MPSIIIGDIQVSGTTMTVEVRVRPGTLSLFTYEGQLVVSRQADQGSTVRKDFNGSSSGQIETRSMTVDLSQFQAIEGETFMLTANLVEPEGDSYQVEVEVSGDGTSQDPITGGGGSTGGGSGDGSGGTGGTENGVAGTGLSGSQIAVGLGAVAGSAYIADKYL